MTKKLRSHASPVHLENGDNAPEMTMRFLPIVVLMAALAANKTEDEAYCVDHSLQV
jgi:hypothetical protein